MCIEVFSKYYNHDSCFKYHLVRIVVKTYISIVNEEKINFDIKRYLQLKVNTSH